MEEKELTRRGSQRRSSVLFAAERPRPGAAGLFLERRPGKPNENSWPISGRVPGYTAPVPDHPVLGRRGPAFLRTYVGDGSVLRAYTPMSSASVVGRPESVKVSSLNKRIEPMASSTSASVLQSSVSDALLVTARPRR